MNENIVFYKSFCSSFSSSSSSSMNQDDHIDEQKVSVMCKPVVAGAKTTNGSFPPSLFSVKT